MMHLNADGTQMDDTHCVKESEGGREQSSQLNRRKKSGKTVKTEEGIGAEDGERGGDMA